MSGIFLKAGAAVSGKSHGVALNPRKINTWYDRAMTPLNLGFYLDSLERLAYSHEALAVGEAGRRNLHSRYILMRDHPC